MGHVVPYPALGGVGKRWQELASPLLLQGDRRFSLSSGLHGEWLLLPTLTHQELYLVRITFLNGHPIRGLHCSKASCDSYLTSNRIQSPHPGLPGPAGFGCAPSLLSSLPQSAPSTM